MNLLLNLIKYIVVSCFSLWWFVVRFFLLNLPLRLLGQVKRLFLKSRYHKPLPSLPEKDTPDIKDQRDHSTPGIKIITTRSNDYKAGWKPDWTILKKSPGTAAAQNLLDLQHDLFVEPPFISVQSSAHSKKPVKSVVYSMDKLRVELVGETESEQSIPKLLMVHGSPLVVTYVGSSDVSTMYWYFESRLEREMVYWSIKSSKDAQKSSRTKFDLEARNPWLSLMERLWLIWREQTWFHLKLQNRIQNILNKVSKPSFLKSIKLNRIDLPLHPPRFQNLEQLAVDQNLVKEWQCHLQWNETVKLNITVDIGGRVNDLLVTMNELNGLFKFSVVSEPSPLLHLHFAPPGPTFHLTVDTVEGSTISIPSWLQQKLEKKMRKAIIRQMVGNHSIIFDWSSFGSNPNEKPTISAPINNDEKLKIGETPATPSLKTPERSSSQQSGWSWALGVPVPSASSFLSPRPSVQVSSNNSPTLSPIFGKPAKSSTDTYSDKMADLGLSDASIDSQSSTVRRKKNRSKRKLNVQGSKTIIENEID